MGNVFGKNFVTKIIPLPNGRRSAWTLDFSIFRDSSDLMHRDPL